MERNRYQIAEVANVVEAATSHLVDASAYIQTLSYDSRKITNPSEALFFALSGRRDGHQFLGEAYQAGVRNFVVKNGAKFSLPEADCNLLYVTDPLLALQKLAAFHRRQFHYPLIAITGSNGKTIVKEWLYQLLSPEYRVMRSPRSYNSQLGVPLSLWQLGDQYDLAIIEAGISQVGEMSSLAQMIQPTVGVLTNIGHAHDEGFFSMEEKISEKLLLFKQVDWLVYSSTYVGQVDTVPGKSHFTWSLGEEADLRVTTHLAAGEQRSLLQASFKDKRVELWVPFTDRASIENLVCCWAVLLSLHYKMEDIMPRLQHLIPVSMRLELKKGINNCSVIDDSYSNDLSSLAIALDFLKQQQQHAHRTLILSDIPSDSTSPEEVYTRVASLLADNRVDLFLGVGEHLSAWASLFNMEGKFFLNTEALLAYLPSLQLYNTTILIKGARSFGFERVSKLLTLQTHETTLEINLGAIEHNLNVYKSLLKEQTRLMVMVKAFSYGSGSFEIANVLQFNKVDYLTVAYVDEGITLRKGGIKLPIVVMSPGIDAFEELVRYDLEPEIFSARELSLLTGYLESIHRVNYPIHVKLDTGMHRLGFDIKQLDLLISLLRATERVQVKSVFSHLVASGDPRHDDFTRGQLQLFQQLTHQLEEALGYGFLRHIANTSAISRFPEAQLDMVRLGIGMYGVEADPSKDLGLLPVARLKTGVSQVKEIPAGETIGYNRHGHLKGDGKIATVKIGYADGYNRRFGNGVGKMKINGHIVPTVGDICMDMCMLDITGLDVSEGDEVLVMGDELTAGELAKAIGTIPYEVLTGISQRVRRVYYYE